MVVAGLKMRFMVFSAEACLSARMVFLGAFNWIV
jgi:hypothetical protein